MDINMPELNGVEATREISRQQKEIGVIILSMYLAKEHLYQAFQARARGYLLKDGSGRCHSRSNPVQPLLEQSADRTDDR